MKPRLFEALMQKDNDQKHAYEELKRKADTNPFLKRYVAMGVKEGLFSDSANALGLMHDAMVESAWSQQIGRAIINVKPTSEALERFPLDEGAVAYQYAEGAVVRLSGKKPGKVDVSTNITVESGDQWTKEFDEDATWNVMNRMVNNTGRAVGLKETQKVIELYASIADADLATGAALAGGGTVFSWAQLLSLHYAVRSQNWWPNVLAINEMQLHQLLNDENFRNGLMLPSSSTDIQQGTIGTILGMTIQASTEIPKTGSSGIRSTIRFGLGILRSNAVAKMTNIKATLT
jgi:hypothetical protein